MLGIIRGFDGHPSHPPMTDVAIGSYTVGAAFLIAAFAGFEQDPLATAGFYAFLVGFAATAAAIVTGFADYFRISRGSSLHRTATLHWISALLSTACFAAAIAALGDGRDTAEVPGATVAMIVIGYLLLAVTGWIGGAIVFVHGMRVVGDTDVPTHKAISLHSASSDQQQQADTEAPSPAPGPDS